MKNIMTMATVATLVLAAVVTTAQDDDKDYFTAGVVGDNYVLCGVSDGELGVEVDFEQELGFCLGGNNFIGLDEGDYEIAIDDELAVAGPSGAYRVHDAEGTVAVDNVDECFDPPLTTTVPDDGTIIVWVDGVVWWSLGQPCGVGQTSQGTVGTISISLL